LSKCSLGGGPRSSRLNAARFHIMSSHVILVHDQANTNLIAKAAGDFFVVRRWHANMILLELLDNLIAAFFTVDYFQFSLIT
jgi:hypothetical protein